MPGIVIKEQITIFLSYVCTACGIVETVEVDSPTCFSESVDGATYYIRKAIYDAHKVSPAGWTSYYKEANDEVEYKCNGCQ